MHRKLRYFLSDDYGGVVDTIVVIGIIVLVTGPVLLVLSDKIKDLLERIIQYVTQSP